jgi:O-antigen biosynthesis protein
MIKRNFVRAVRKSAHISRRVFTVGANFSSRVEDKAHRIINGLDSTIVLNDKILFEKLYYQALPYITPIHPALPTVGRKGRISLLIPSMQKSSFFGGTATAIIFAAIAAEESDKPLYIIETLKKGSVDPKSIADFLLKNNITFNQSIVLLDLSPRKYDIYGYIDIHPDDVFIVSAWWDAHLLERLPLVKKFIYLIQDYEPIFYNNSDMQVLAERTYHSERFIPVCNTKLMLKFMDEKGYKYIADKGLFFEPAVNMSKLATELANKNDRKRLFIYGRPSVERNLFYSALKALDEAFTEELIIPAEWECYMAGQDGVSNILLETGQVVISLGKLTLDDYYNFAKTIDLGISLMLAPHPSYPPLELSSLGAAVVTTSYETKDDLSIYNGNLFTAEPNVDDIKNKLVQASKLSKTIRHKNAINTKLPQSWEEALLPTVKLALKKQ